MESWELLHSLIIYLLVDVPYYVDCLQGVLVGDRSREGVCVCDGGIVHENAQLNLSSTLETLQHLLNLYLVLALDHFGVASPEEVAGSYYLP